MLQKIRDGASGPLAYIVVGVITVVFGVWGIGSYFTPSADPVVASAGDTDITQSQLQRAFDQRYQRLRQMMGDNFDSSMFPPGQIRHRVLDSLINEAVTQQYAKDAGYQVSDANLLATIRSNPQFQQNGQFSTERYKTLLAQAGIQPAQYEARLRQSLLSNQLEQIVAAGAFAAPPEVDARFKAANAQRRIAVLNFDPSAYQDQVAVDDQAVQAYYNAHKQQFMQPAKVKLSYVSLNANTLSTDAAPSEQTLHTLYDQHRTEFGAPEKRSADVVRIPITDGDDDAARQTVQAIAAAMKGRDSSTLKAQAGKHANARFEQIDAQAQSAMPTALGNALFGMDKGQLSNPVRTDNAWYVARLTGVTPADHPDFDDAVVQNRLKAMARQKAKAKTFHNKSQTLGDLAYQAPNDLQTISKKLDLPIQTTGWITQQDGGGIGQYQAVRDAAFSDAVLKDKLNSKVVNLGEQRQIVLRVADHQAAKPQPESAVAGTIRRQLVRQKAQDKARAAAQAAMAKLQQGSADLQDIARQGPAQLSSPGWVGRDGSNVASAVSKAAFAVPLSGADGQQKTGYRIATTDQGSVALVAVQDERVQSGGDRKQTTQQRDRMAKQQRQYNAALEYAALDNYIREQADVSIKKDSLRQSPGQNGQGDPATD
ncbi:SurA N-terminal domain-containing protein [Salinisphaera sp. Q1T1-3]|uniref:SurA N-terminal domain-containing protein n=1 Tax=Salinisphaera sp. Q1T1-3 TaxID=2321229 RepID=UPI001314875A|nr:SurA N-terminal domain-containing protein [Salinisphaera sp. Q1T1-3]